MLQDLSWKPLIQKGDEPVYVALVRALAEDISAGKLASGYRLPTQRDLADQLGIALGTVTRAYTEAEKRGLVHGDGRRGTFVGPIPKARSVLANMNKGASIGVDFSRNHPGDVPDAEFRSLLKKIAQDPDCGQLLRYPPVSGFAHHREAGARWLQSLGLQANAETIHITGGAQHALTVIFAAESATGDIIATEEYVYPGAKATAEMLGLQVIGVEMDDQGLIPDELEKLCKHRNVRLLYVNPTYQNPTNSIMPLERRRQIGEIAERYNVTVVEDEIYSPLLDEPPTYISSLIPERGYFVCSVSKALAAGLRIGFVASPSVANHRMIETLQASNLGIAPLAGEIFARWYDDGTMDRVIARRRKELARNQQTVADILEGFNFHAGPTSYHVWLELPEQWTGMGFTAEAQRRGVAVTPAELFVADKRPVINAVRLSVGAVSDRAALKTGLEVLRDILAGTLANRGVLV